MNNTAFTPTWFETLQRHYSQILHSSCFGLPCLQRQHQVHPLNTNSGRSKFLQLSSLRRIRIIHVDSRKLSNSDSLCRKPSDPHNVQKRHSMVSNTCDSSMDDYWFTRWSQPLRISNNCNCSFKRQGKYPRDTEAPLISQGQDEMSSNFEDNDLLKSPTVHLRRINNHLPHEVSDIRNFAIEFIQNILDDAITHVTLSKPNDTYHFNSNVTLTSEPQQVLLADCTETTMTDLCKPTGGDGQLSASDLPSQVQDGEFVLDINEDCFQFQNSLNVNSGCVNMSFLCSSSDPTTNMLKPRNKSCNHTKKPKKPLLYFLHGVGSSADIWWGLLRFFVSAGYEVLAPDMLGHGYSAAPDQSSAYTFQHLLKDAVDIFDRFVGEHGKCVVIGHAYGCSLAAAVARYRTQVTHLVLISGGGPTPLAPSQQEPMFPCLRGCLEAFLICGFKRDVLYAPCGKQMAPCPALSSDAPEYVLRYMARGQDWPEGDSTFHRRILVPTLLVHGMRDPHVTLVQECEMERTIPRSFLELIPNAGHLAMLETPAQLSHMINCFIDWWSR